jgi:hypothetical protein
MTRSAIASSSSVVTPASIADSTACSASAVMRPGSRMAARSRRDL